MNGHKCGRVGDGPAMTSAECPLTIADSVAADGRPLTWRGAGERPLLQPIKPKQTLRRFEYARHVGQPSPHLDENSIDHERPVQTGSPVQPHTLISGPHENSPHPAQPDRTRLTRRGGRTRHDPPPLSFSASTSDCRRRICRVITVTCAASERVSSNAPLAMLSERSAAP
jgi:hypothetical protein